MYTMTASRKRYILIGILGALAGGIGLVLLIKAIPKMLSQMMMGMMRKMMAQMEQKGCAPSEI